jgi:hypothetical protein
MALLDWLTRQREQEPEQKKRLIEAAVVAGAPWPLDGPRFAKDFYKQVQAVGKAIAKERIRMN